MTRIFLALAVLVAGVALGWPDRGQAQSPRHGEAAAKAKPPSPQALFRATTKAKVNGGTVGFIADTVGSTHTRMTADVAAVLDKGDELRVLPVLGRGALQSITDILYLRGIDFGIVQSDVLKYIKDEGIYPGIENRINYVTKLHNQEFHIIARKDIRTLEDLRGKKVNFGIKGSGAYITATAVFKAYSLKVVTTEFDEVNALDKLKLGEIAAMVYVAGKPAPLFASVAADDGLHLVPVPYKDSLVDYLPAKFTARDYPALVEEGKTVSTVAVRAVLAVFNWRPGGERYKKAVRFVSTFFTNFHELRKPPRHPKWREVNIYAKVPGWKRFPPATEWVERKAREVAEKRKRLQPKKQAAATAPMKQAFVKFLNARRQAGQARALSGPEVDKLFERFQQWQKARGQ